MIFLSFLYSVFKLYSIYPGGKAFLRAVFSFFGKEEKLVKLMVLSVNFISDFQLSVV